MTADRPRRRPADVAIAWSLVGIQALLIVAIVLVPPSDTPPPSGALSPIATALTWAGIALVGWAVAVFGRGVTPSPLPSPKARLRTRGPYRWIRHPMYTGVMLWMAGAALARRRVLAVALWVLLVAFFVAKARWEERRLAAAYPGYADYRERTPAFIPTRLIAS